jgi:pimeloyl-ACP methyl ester carboxylesterase
MNKRTMIARLFLFSLLSGGAVGFFFNVPSVAKPTVPENVKLLILPGFGNDSVDYTREKSIVASLQERGWKPEQIDVLPVQRGDWLQVFTRGIFDLKFWAGDAAPIRPAFRWYLERIAEKIEALGEEEEIVLVGHSAGGWLARAALGFGSSDEDAPPVDLSKVSGVVTLGSPHLPPPPAVMDMTRGALRITNEKFPGTHHSPSLFYLTTIGLAVVGKEQENKSPLEKTTVQGFAYNSYEAVCGDGTTIGDGVVPQCAGHLEDALQVRWLRRLF